MQNIGFQLIYGQTSLEKSCNEKNTPEIKNTGLNTIPPSNVISTTKLMIENIIPPPKLEIPNIDKDKQQSGFQSGHRYLFQIA